MEAKELSKKVRDYFYEIYGQYGFVGFQIEKVHEEKVLWTIECSFLQSMIALEKERICYRVIIDSLGIIKEISRFEPALC